MRKLVVGTFMTLDGVMQAPGGPDEDREGGFEHGGWAVSYFDNNMMGIMADQINRAGALLFGRKTYEIFAGSWPNAAEDDQFGVKINAVPKYVASRTLKTVAWNNSTLLKGDIVEEITKLKQNDGAEIQVPGSGDLIQSLIKHNLVDEFRLMIFPVIVGSGKRLFSEGTAPEGLKLIDSKTTDTGVTINTYQPAGSVQYGEMDPAQEHERKWRRD